MKRYMVKKKGQERGASRRNPQEWEENTNRKCGQSSGKRAGDNHVRPELLGANSEPFNMCSFLNSGIYLFFEERRDDVGTVVI